jgi:hypothetical protein
MIFRGFTIVNDILKLNLQKWSRLTGSTVCFTFSLLKDSKKGTGTMVKLYLAIQGNN